LRPYLSLIRVNLLYIIINKNGITGMPMATLSQYVNPVSTIEPTIEIPKDKTKLGSKILRLFNAPDTKEDWEA
jgi:hypothetical protein